MRGWRGISGPGRSRCAGWCSRQPGTSSSGDMSFDLRLPIGALFTLFGLILAADGLLARRLVLGINVNLWWGLVMLLFGGLMLGFAARKTTTSAAPHDASERPRSH